MTQDRKTATSPEQSTDMTAGRRSALRLGAAALSGVGLMAAGGLRSAAQAADTPPLESEFLFSASIERGKLTDLGESKLGRKRVGSIDGGTFEGPRMTGVVLPGGGYFQTIRDNGGIMLHTEYLLRTDDDVTIFTRNEAVAIVRPDDSLYVRASIVFEAPADSAYAWLHDYLFVGSGQPNMETNSTDLIVYQIL